MDKKYISLIIGLLLTTSVFLSCEEKGLLVNANDISYVIFEKNMTTDTTTTSFKFYDEEENGDKYAPIELNVQIYGKLRDTDTHFAVSIDEERNTVAEGYYQLPSDCVIKAGELTGKVTVVLKNYAELADTTLLLAIKINEQNDVKAGSFQYSRALIAVTDRLFKPDWWSVNDRGNEDSFSNTIEDFYLGEYSDRKYELLLSEFRKDNYVFDGKNMQMMRKYALRLKNTLKELAEAGTPAVDKGGKMITVVVPG